MQGQMMLMLTKTLDRIADTSARAEQRSIETQERMQEFLNRTYTTGNRQGGRKASVEHVSFRWQDMLSQDALANATHYFMVSHGAASSLVL